MTVTIALEQAIGRTVADMMGKHRNGIQQALSLAAEHKGLVPISVTLVFHTDDNKYSIVLSYHKPTIETVTESLVVNAPTEDK